MENSGGISQVQTLIVLGEEVVRNRLLADALRETERENEELQAQLDGMRQTVEQLLVEKERRESPCPS